MIKTAEANSLVIINSTWRLVISLRNFSGLCVSVVVLGLTETLNKLWLMRTLFTVSLECWGQPKNHR